jgi:hypothetical protein
VRANKSPRVKIWEKLLLGKMMLAMEYLKMYVIEYLKRAR